MSILLAQTATLQLFAPVLFAAIVVLFVLVIGRFVATRNFTRAVRANAGWAPSIPAASSFPLNQPDSRPRRRLSELGLRRVEVSPADSTSATLRMNRVYLDASELSEI